jgi:hypothetical protein
MNSIELQKYISELEQQKIDIEPLCKTKTSKQPEAVLPIPNAPIEKVKKPRAPKTQAQLDSFKITLQKRKSAVEQRVLNRKIENAKLLLGNEMKNRPIPIKQKPIDSESESEEEIVIKPKKRKTKKIIIEDSSSESESEEEPLVHKKDFGRSHCNKKSSAIKIHEQPLTYQNQQQPQLKRNFFCD